jgi:DNA ligase (NAD+)
MGETSARKLVARIEASKRRPLPRLLYALGIRHVGETAAEVLAAHWPSLAALRTASEDELQQVADIGPALAALGARASSTTRTRPPTSITCSSAASIRRRRRAAAAGSGPLAGQSFLFTGTLSRLSRREAQERVKALGARLLSAVSANLDVLVVGEKPGSKLKKAQELGVRC